MSCWSAGSWTDRAGRRLPGAHEERTLVTIVQNPAIRLPCRGDEARDAAQDGPVILVGHSYGGAVVTEAAPPGRGRGLHRRVAPDAGESVASLIKIRFRRPVADVLPPQDGFLFLVDQVPRLVRRDVEASAAGHGGLAGPMGPRRVGRAITQPAWRSKRAGTGGDNDRMIPPDARAMSKRAGSAVVEVRAATRCRIAAAGGRVLIATAAKGVGRTGRIVAIRSALRARVRIRPQGGRRPSGAGKQHIWRGQLAIAERVAVECY